MTANRVSVNIGPEMTNSNPPSLQPLPLSLYIHMPWCIKKCPYCDFNSHAVKEDLNTQAYIEKLIADFESSLPLIWGRPIQTIFIGGGTPSLFDGASYQILFNALRGLCPFSPNAEITMEANPGTLEHANFEQYLEAGINRLSLGVQSFNDKHLKALGRIHGSAEATDAVAKAKQAGFNNINVDIMYALPEQTPDEAMADLRTALSLETNHLSWYQLTLEPNTAFAHSPPPLPDEESQYTIMEQGLALLAAHGFERYEISAYSKDNSPCRHNLNYWTFGDYLGIGAGAHSKLTLHATNEIVRVMKHKHPKAYQSATDDFVAVKTVIAREELPFEYMLNALRLLQPVRYEEFEARTGVSRACLATPLQEAAEHELIVLGDESFELSEKGRLFTDNVVQLFMKGA